MPHRSHRLTLVAAIVCIAAAIASVGAVARDAAVSPETITDAHVRLAIDAIVEELYNRKDPQRFWEPIAPIPGESPQEGGHTALVVLSLLYAGESYQSPRLADAISYLEDAPFEGTYAVAVRAGVWAQLPERFLPLLERDARWLLDSYSFNGGGWAYRANPRNRRQDNSLLQYGTLGLWEAARRGVRIEHRYWQRIEDQFLRMQVEDGGWNYQGDGPSTGSMTSAGIASLHITRDMLRGDAFADLRRRGASPADHPAEAAIRLAESWMDQHFAVDENPNNFRYYYYYMYNLERAGLAGGHKFFGERDWFRHGAAELINRFCAWDPESRTMRMHDRVGGVDQADTVSDRSLAFGLMFLSRGRVPVAVNKLRHGDSGWNNRPGDVSAFTQWMREISVTDVNWQVVDMARPAWEWLDAPMLYVAGSEPPQWYIASADAIDDHVMRIRRYQREQERGIAPGDAPMPAMPDIPELARLREYLELGGLIVAVNEGSGTAFADSIETIGEAMFPEYTWRTLEDGHPAYTLLWSVPNPLPPLRALSNGVRELIILSPRADFSHVLQRRATDQVREYQTMGNIYLYASEKKALRPRLAQHAILTHLDDDDPGGDGEPYRIVQAIHDGQWNAEPAALNVFRAAMAQDAPTGRNMRIAIDRQPLERIDALDPPPDLVIVSSIKPIDLADAERRAIHRFTTRDEGGVVLFETIGGVGNFAAKMEQAIADAFDIEAQSTLRAPVITGRGLDGAVSLSRVTYRPYAVHVHGSREVVPRLRGMALPDGGDAMRVFFSREDITHGLLDQPCWGVSGYSAQAARDLLANLLIYSRALRTQSAQP